MEKPTALKSVSIKYYCSKIDKILDKAIDGSNICEVNCFVAPSSDGSMYAHHGELEIEVCCKCGDRHLFWLDKESK